MDNPDEAIERISRQLIRLPDDQFEPFVANHLATANYRIPSGNINGISHVAKDRDFFTNNSLWEAILYERLRRTDLKIVLDGFFLFEWLPRSPGLFFTPKGRNARSEAQRNIESIHDDLIVYNPTGKASMLDGGVGNVRLKPIEIGGNTYCLMSASSSGVCHEGFPVAVPIGFRNDCIEEITDRGAVVRKLVGYLKFIPENLVSLYRGYADVPQLYLEVQDVLPAEHQQSRHMQELRVSVAVSFASNYEGSRKVYVAYVNFDPGERGSFQRKVNWMEQEYVIGKYQGKVITDFDQQRANFPNAVFSLEKVMNLNLIDNEVRQLAGTIGIDAERVINHQSQVVISIGEFYADSKYKVIGGHVEALGDNAQVRNVTQPTDNRTQAKPPDSLSQAWIHILWSTKPRWRNLFLAVTGIFVIGFIVWGSLPDATKINLLSSILDRPPARAILTPEQTKDLRFYVAMGDSIVADNPREALSYYQKALEIDPQNEEIKKKVDSLTERLTKGS